MAEANDSSSEVDCEYRTDQDEVSASDLEYTEFDDSDMEASDTDTENQAEYNDAVRNFFFVFIFYI